MIDRSQQTVRPRVVFGVATALGFFSALQVYYFVSTFTPQPASFPLLLALNLAYWYSWACLTPAVVWLAWRFPIERGTWRLSLAVHGGSVFIATLLHVGMTVASKMAIYWTIGEPTGAWLPQAQEMFLLNFDWEMMTYWAIIGLSHSQRYHHEAQDRALRQSQ